MHPIAVFRFSPTEGPAHFGEWLSARGLPWELVALDAGAPVPDDAAQWAGIGMMGGPMSVNDPLPWIAPMERLLRDAVQRGVPVLGHCLGGQLLARALGATVRRTERPEIGWIDVDVAEGFAPWFGGRRRFTAFQWHNEVFDVPDGAVPALTNGFNPNQGYVLDERHVGLQCHVEMTQELVRSWCDSGADELPPHTAAALQSRDDILRAMPDRLPGLSDAADALYARWSQGLAR